MDNGFQALDDLHLCVGFPGEEHSIKEFVTPDQVMVAKHYEKIASEADDDVVWSCWNWVCSQIRYPLTKWGVFADYHELNSFGLKKLRTKGEYFQLPFQTLVVGYGDCMDKTAVLVSFIENTPTIVHGVLGNFDGKEDEVNHAWAMVEIAGKSYILETTLREATPWKMAEDLPNYMPLVYFNSNGVWAKEYLTDLFCCINISPERIMAIWRCWQC